MTSTQNRTMDAGMTAVPSPYGVMMTGGGGFSADDAAAETVTAELLRRGYRVVERQALNGVLREQGLQQSGNVDQATALRLGKLAGAEAIVIANVYNSSSAYHQGHQRTGDSVVDIVGGMLNPSGMIYYLDMTVKMIDAQTAEVVWLEDKSAQSSPGEKTTHTQLLRDAVSSLSFPTPRSAVATVPTENTSPRTKIEPAKPKKEPPDPEVRQAQGILRELGYDPGSIDGRMGRKTHEALRQFQRDRDLPETGQVDTATKAALQLMLQPVTVRVPARDPGQIDTITAEFREQPSTLQQKATQPATEDYVVRTSTTPDGDKVRMEVSVWDMRLGKLVNWTVVEGRADAIDEKMICDSPSGAPLSSVDKALCDTVRQVRERLRQNFLPPRVQVLVTSANIMAAPSIQSARVATVRQGTVLRKVGEQKGWVKVALESGEVGWIYGELTK